MNRHVAWFNEIGIKDVGRVGGKNASLGEMTQRLAGQGIRVPEGFATTADAFWEFLDHNALRPRIEAILARRTTEPLTRVGAQLRGLVREAPWPAGLEASIRQAYNRLCQVTGVAGLAVAVRSSATAEDLPDASFAGQHESYLNVSGADDVVAACKDCYASLFTDRAIMYRDTKGFDHARIALSVGVQRMVRSDSGAAGVMFTIDTETGFPNAIVINSAWGLGESIVQGTVTPDQFTVFKPGLQQGSSSPIIGRGRGSKLAKRIYKAGGGTHEVATTPVEAATWSLSDPDVVALAGWGRAIESHYGRAMDIEWASDGPTGDLFIVQARPETIHSKPQAALVTYRLEGPRDELAAGIAVGTACASGPVVRIDDPKDATRVPMGAVLVTRITDPDWVPAMRRASAIVTDLGGRTCHAAIVSRELGIPAIVGAGDATKRLQVGRDVTVSCADGPVGRVYAGRVPFSRTESDLRTMPATRTKLNINVGDPDEAMRWWRLPAAGIGLARMEFIIASTIKVHPMALLHPDVLTADERRQIEALTQGEPGRDFFVRTLASGIARIAASRYPAPVLLRLSDFKTNEYASLIGGGPFEPKEENPMIGWRGASRYYSEYREGFALECKAIRLARESMGLRNVAVLVPFCRTVAEARLVLDELKLHGLERGREGLQVWLMCEIPSNAILAQEFAALFDGFSIGSNDLTQLTLGVDRDSGRLSRLFTEDDDAVKALIRMAIAGAHAAGVAIGLCGQAPSDRPAFAAFLVEAGIDSISVAPDAFLSVARVVADAEAAGAKADSRP